MVSKPPTMLFCIEGFISGKPQIRITLWCMRHCMYGQADLTVHLRIDLASTGRAAAALGTPLLSS
jgi:hypothetical protein